MAFFRGTGLVALLVAVGTTVAPTARGRERVSEASTLAIALALGAPVPDIARRSMINEATRIWRQEGVTITWQDASGLDTARAAVLRVVVVHVELSPSAAPRTYAIAEFHRQQSRIVASLPAAERTVQAGLQDAARAGWPAHQSVHALGLVLGRALAHEFGHYLLGTGDHSRHGLMRATISAREFVDPRGTFFALHDDEAALLARRLDEGFLRRTWATH